MTWRQWCRQWWHHFVLTRPWPWLCLVRGKHWYRAASIQSIPICGRCGRAEVRFLT
jgi:hypothetical protein